MHPKKAHKPASNHPWIVRDRQAILRHRERKAMRISHLENEGASIQSSPPGTAMAHPLSGKEQPHE